MNVWVLLDVLLSQVSFTTRFKIWWEQLKRQTVILETFVAKRFRTHQRPQKTNARNAFSTRSESSNVCYIFVVYLVGLQRILALPKTGVCTLGSSNKTLAAHE